ncbi:MAG: hypothetical protein JWM03_1691, partial [Rhodocyclales bacterium]|nr:hypothetical protein [Rhodocyclales bacterium]
MQRRSFIKATAMTIALATAGFATMTASA